MVYVPYFTSDLLGDTAASRYSTIIIRYEPQKEFVVPCGR